MTLEHFRNGVEEATNSDIPRVSNVQLQDAGEVFFICFVPSSEPLMMQLVVEDPVTYGNESQYLVFTESNIDDPDLCQCFQELGGLNTWPSIKDALTDISSMLYQASTGKYKSGTMRKRAHAPPTNASHRDMPASQNTTIAVDSKLEHELMFNPYSVDVLICFFYTALAASKVTNMPTDLSVKLIHTGSGLQPTEHYTTQASSLRNIMFVSPKEMKTEQPLKEGDIILVVSYERLNSQADLALYWAGYEQRVCQILSINNGWIKFVHLDSKTPQQDAERLIDDQHSQSFRPNECLEAVHVFGFWHNTDDLPQEQLEIALCQTLDCLPSVLQMRTWLFANPRDRIHQWSRMNYTFKALLDWIVTHPTFFVVQDDSVPSPYNEADRLASRTKIQDIPPQYMQFRLVSESTIPSMLDDPSIKYNAQYPTIFGTYYGTDHEFHNILELGLESVKRRQPRLLSNGVQFTQRFSEPPTGPHRRDLVRNYLIQRSEWMRTVLRPYTPALLCEIINDPESETLQIENMGIATPTHLFVCVSPTAEALDLRLGPKFKSTETTFVQQDPDRHLTAGEWNTKKNVNIPAGALAKATYRIYVQIQDTDISDAESFTEPEDELEPQAKRRKKNNGAAKLTKSTEYV